VLDTLEPLLHPAQLQVPPDVFDLLVSPALAASLNHQLATSLATPP
jgi:hypothetical protein